MRRLAAAGLVWSVAWVTGCSSPAGELADARDAAADVTADTAPDLDSDVGPDAPDLGSDAAPDATSDDGAADTAGDRPDTAPDVGPGGCEPLPASSVWTHVEQLDPKDTDINSISALSPTVAWALGRGRGDNCGVYRWNGSTWTQTGRLPGYDGTIHAFSDTNVWATCGSDVRQWNGSAWTDRTPPGFTNVGWRSVWGSGPTDVWVASNPRWQPGVVVHWDGQTWTDYTAGLAAGTNGVNIWGLWGTGSDDVWAVGFTSDAGGATVGLVKHWDGRTWAVPPANDPIAVQGRAFTSVAGTSAHDVWVATVYEVWHYDGATWHVTSAPSLSGVYSIWTGCPGDLWLVYGDLTYRFDGNTMRPFPLYRNRPRVVTGSGPLDVWIGGTVNPGYAVISHRVDDGPAGCGNGRVDPGEVCDPPDAVTCSTSCLSLVSCGNGVVEPAYNEQCDPPNGTTCGPNCRTEFCGNRKVETGETCDYGNDGEFCRKCRGTCRAACPWPRAPDTCAALSGEDQFDCAALLNCMAMGLSLCVYTVVPGGGYGPQGCYCSDAACSKGADGQCAKEFHAVAKSTDPAEVLRQLADPTTTVAGVGEMARRYGSSSFCLLGCRGME